MILVNTVPNLKTYKSYVIAKIPEMGQERTNDDDTNPCRQITCISVDKILVTRHCYNNMITSLYTRRISREHWAGALMEVRSLFGLNSETRDQRTHGPTNGPTDRRTDGRTKPLIELRVRD